jgi:hypothetical protein
MGWGRCPLDSCLFWRYQSACSGGMNALMPKASRALLKSCRPSWSLGQRRPLNKAKPKIPKQGQAQNPRRTVRALPPRLVYPTTPVSGLGSSSSSGIDVDKVPASVNIVDVNKIQRTQSLNIADACRNMCRASLSVKLREIHSSRTCNFAGLSHLLGRAHLRDLQFTRTSSHQRSIRRHGALGSDSDRPRYGRLPW